jgi:cytochrome c biogenesis protein CcmG/thiol:disulfide interchange protein DsbE
MRFVAVIATCAAAVALGSCSDQDEPSEAKPVPKVRGAPSRLGQLYDQPNELVDVSEAEFDALLDDLRGYPVVINKWASWCGPCREEFPIFRRFALSHGKRVAVIGLLSADGRDPAETFLSDNPVPYPSFADPDEEIGDAKVPSLGLPATAIYRPDGERAYVRQGPYDDFEALERDVMEHTGVR